MNKIAIIGGLGAVGLLLLTAAKARAATNLSVQSVTGPRDIVLGNDGLRFGMTINVTNPDGVGVNVKSVALNNFFGTTQLGQSILFQPVTIASYAVTPVNVLILIPYLQLLAVIPDFIQVAKTKTFNFTLQGIVKAESLQIPVNKNFQFQLPKLY